MSNRLDSLAVRFHHENELHLAASIVTIGAFDGVHRGHQELIRQTVARAQQRGMYLQWCIRSIRRQRSSSAKPKH